MAQPHFSFPDRAAGARARVIALRPEFQDAAASPERPDLARGVGHPGGPGGTAGSDGRARPTAVTGGWVPDIRRRRRRAPSLRGRSVPGRSVPGRVPHEPSSGAFAAAEPRVARMLEPDLFSTGEPRPDTDCRERPAELGPGGIGDAAADPEPDGRRTWAAQLVRRGPWGQLAERWVPESVRGARVSPGRRGAVVLSVVAALAAVVAAVGVWWHRPNPAPVSPVALPPAAGAAPSAVGSAGGHRTIAVRPPAVTGSAAPSSPAAQHPASAPAPSTTPTGPILVSVTGQVRHPGVVAVPADARVADAIAAAGGALDPSDLTGLNLAAHLVDGASVVVAGPDGSVVDAAGSPAGVPAAGVPPGRAGTTGVASSPVDLNTADQATLETLPGVGPVTAAAILAWRTDHGPFTDVDQLQAIPGIGPAKYAQISPHVTVGQ